MSKYQIMVFVGNGFDIAALSYTNSDITTSYESFYSFFRYRFPQKKANSLMADMEEAKREGRKNWADFEMVISRRLANVGSRDTAVVDALKHDLNDIQYAFSQFLNDVVSSEVIYKVSEYSSKKSLALNSLSRILADLSLEQHYRCNFLSKIRNHDVLKYVFINFNFTPLLDNYIYLDRDNFDPVPNRTTKNNFRFMTNPRCYPSSNMYFTDPYCHLTTEIIHPHGYQGVPKSLLFGVEPITIDSSEMRPDDLRRGFVKSYWAQSEERYSDYIKDTNLFVIYGCSLGATDNWWWRRIYDRLKDNDNPAELIIYNYKSGDEDEQAVKQKFYANCCLNDSQIDDVAEANIFVINFDSSEISRLTFLQFQ